MRRRERVRRAPAPARTAANACAGKNACKGTGFLMLSKGDCDAAKAKLKK